MFIEFMKSQMKKQPRKTQRKILNLAYSHQ
nr:MAG TPA: hypothetical protein [Caudoviricetes sp.]